MTPEHLQDEKIGQLDIKVYKKTKSEKWSTGAFIILLTNYARSPFWDSESFIWSVIGLDENDIHFVIYQYI